MTLDISASFSFSLAEPSDVLLQFEVANIPEQTVISAHTSMPGGEYHARVPSQDSVGERIWLRTSGPVDIQYNARVDIRRLTPDLVSLAAMQQHQLPGEAVPYLFGSRYCPSDRLQNFVGAEFGNTAGGERIAAISEWIGRNISYRPGMSDAATTALDTMTDRAGICRDFAHVLIALARASSIPARYASVYAPQVKPQDFHAIAEVFLANPAGPGGEWVAIDATGMAVPGEMAKIGIGRDAADVSFLTSFGPCNFGWKQVIVTSVAE
jgi:transglutaminase-like putative cysteine protease